MSRIDGFRIQGNTKDIDLKMPTDMSRDNNLRHIGCSGMLIEDRIGSAPEIEHYNNYNSSGVHNNSTIAASTVHTDASETSIFTKDVWFSQYTKPDVDVFVSSANHSYPVLWDLRHPEIDRIICYARQGIQDFMTGKTDTADITRIIENMYNDLLEYNISLGKTDGTDPHYNAHILFNVQGKFVRLTLDEAYSANNAEGLAYAQENYGLNPDDRFVYYNASYYFANKELQGICNTAVENIAQNEEFDFYIVQGFYNTPYHHFHCFNAMWQENAMGSNIAKMKDTGIDPPKDFIMFFTPRRFSQEAWNNGPTQMITASDPTRTDGHGTVDFFIKVPKGWSLFKPLPFWLSQGSYTNQDGENFVTWDITKHIKFNAGDDLQSRLKEFFDEYVTSLNHGELVVWSDGTKNVYDVPFDFYFDEKRMFHGSELTSAVAKSDFIRNFEFHMFSYFV